MLLGRSNIPATLAITNQKTADRVFTSVNGFCSLSHFKYKKEHRFIFMGRLDSLASQMRGDDLRGGGEGDESLPLWLKFLNFMNTAVVAGRSGGQLLGILVAIGFIWLEPNWVGKYILIVLSYFIAYGVRSIFIIGAYAMALLGKLTLNAPFPGCIKNVFGAVFLMLLPIWTLWYHDGKGITPFENIWIIIAILLIPIGVVFGAMCKRYLA